MKTTLRYIEYLKDNDIHERLIKEVEKLLPKTNEEYKDIVNIKIDINLEVTKYGTY